ncbi:MAG: carbamoyltransferase HypF [Bryobacteraceae bacterium]
MTEALSIRVRGIVQGVGFRPFVYRLALANRLCGWVRNGENGVEIFLEGSEQSLDAFVRGLKAQPPPAAQIATIDVVPAAPEGITDFTIRDSRRRGQPSVRISPDLAVCGDCLRELFDPHDSRYRYPYINCSHCGPRYSIILGLPYDRASTTMNDWPMDAVCAAQYHEPADRRFHAQPIACPACGPHYNLHIGTDVLQGDDANIQRVAQLLNAGGIVAVKGLGGYHLACDALNTDAVRTLRERKFRKEKPFAIMVRDLAAAQTLASLSPAAETLLTSTARPVVLGPKRLQLDGVAPDCDELGIMLPYTPLHHLLFAAGAPAALVMTSANRSSEPIAYKDEDALQQLSGIADAFLMGERPIARRVDDSVTRAGVFGPVILRRARGYAPAVLATMPAQRPILALGADLKNTVTLVVDGQAFVSQHIGDLDHYPAFLAFQETIEDLISMYQVDRNNLLIVHDCHPQYRSTIHAVELHGAETRAIQHHRAHLASVLAEREEWEKRVVGVSFDGTGYGDDGNIWGGEIFVGSVAEGFERVAHLRPARLPGGDASARHPMQAAAGFLAQLDALPALEAEPFRFTARFRNSLKVAQSGVRTFTTTSAGRLFDAAAALLGFTREASFEGQAAMWVQHQAHSCFASRVYPFPFAVGQLDYRPLLAAVIEDRLRGRDTGEIARSFQRGFAEGIARAVEPLCEAHGADTVVLSGGVFQNELLLQDLKDLLGNRLQIWTNREAPPNDGGISLGQAALASLGRFNETHA